MQVMRHGDTLYVGHAGTTGAGTSILDVSAPDRPELVTQWDAPANTHTHKVQIADGLLLVNHERFPYRPKKPLGPHSAGVAIYRLDDPFEPKQIGFWESGGKGVHRIVWEGGRYAHMSGAPAGIHRPYLDDGRPGRARDDPRSPAAGGGRDSGPPGVRPPTGPTVIGSRRTTVCARASTPTWVTTMRTWSCSTRPIRRILARSRGCGGEVERPTRACPWQVADCSSSPTSNNTTAPMARSDGFT